MCWNHHLAAVLHKCSCHSAAQLLQIRVANTPGKKVEHQGIKVQLLGQIELKTERGSPNDFLALGRSCMHADMQPQLWNCNHG